MAEQKLLWEMLMLPEVNKYFLKTPQKFRNKLNDWVVQKSFYEEAMNHANDNDMFRWSIFLKENQRCIGRISCHVYSEEDERYSSDDIRGIAWIIDPEYQNKGYATEAAHAVLDFMFFECDIKEIITASAVCNIPSWKLMENLGFTRQKETKMVEYTFIDDRSRLTHIY